MSDLAKRLAALTPEQRALFERRMKQRNQRAPKAQAIPRRDLDALCLQSVDQERLWFMYQLEPESAAYNVGFAFRLLGDLNLPLLERSLNLIVQRHEILRTTYGTAEGQAIQQIATDWRIRPIIVDLRDWGAEREAQAQRVLTAQVQQPFNLTDAPPLRVTLLRLDATEHILLTTIHHIATDWWSFNLLHTELFRLYEALTAQPGANTEQLAASLLPELPIQYADFAIWQREWLHTTVLQEQLGYWKQQLTGAPPLELPGDRQRPPIQTFRGARHYLELSPDLASELSALAQREGATLFMLLLAAFNALMHRYTAQDDIVIGSPIANRSRPEIESLIGFFVNTLVLRSNLRGNPSFRELLGRVREVALGAYAHQDMPFAQLVRELNVERDMSRMPLVQVAFLLVGQAPPLSCSALTVESLDFEPGVSMFDLSLALREQVEGMSGFFEYNTDLFDAATIERMAGHWQTLLAAIVADPDQPIATLPLLTPDETGRLLHEWTATASLYPTECSLPELFAAQVLRTPDGLALVDATHQLTFRELDERSNQLAWHLQALGVRAETRVGVCLERSAQVVVALLSVLKAGGCYVPLDPAYPQARLQFMLADAQVSLVLTEQTSQAQLPATTAPMLHLDTLALDRYPVTPPPVRVLPDQLAYIIYTSGSTGQPKGVLGPQRGVVNRLQWMWTAYPFAPEERCCQKTALSFVDSVWEIFGPLLQGVPVVILPDEVVKDPVQLVRTLEEQGITRIVLVPSLLRAILDTYPALHTQLAQLTCWVSSGEALPLDVARRFGEQMPHAMLLNLYGSSEVAADATWFDTRQLADRDHVPLGRPLANMAVYLLDPALQPVPIGVAGELYIGGVGLARGYHGRPDLTAERFLPNPFSAEPGARLYRTGDLGRWLPDGQLAFGGRSDRQVKLRGYRIELGEIESVLRQQEAIRDAAVLVRDQRLVAYVVGEQRNKGTKEHGENPEPKTQNQEEDRNSSAENQNVEQDGSKFLSLGSSDLRAYLKERLPDYMIPSVFMLLDEMPLTPNGKIDRRALPEPERAGAAQAVAPRSETETILARIWADVLSLEQIGVYDNFFDVGGHSLLGTQVMSRVREALGVELPLRTLFEAPTIAELAQRIAASDQRSRRSLPPIQPAERHGDLPLSFAQQRLWFLEQLQPGLSGHNIAAAVRLIGKLDAQALRQSLNDVVDRHESLRTTFAQRDGRACQVIAPSLTLDLPLVDLRSLPATERAAQADRLLATEAQHRFDLARGPLLHPLLLRLDEQTHLLLIVMHHIISDGWSLGLVVREIAALYLAYTSNNRTPALLPELPIQYADFAIWQRTALESVLEEQLAYWRQQLAGAPTTLDLPSDRSRPAVQTLRGAQHTATLPATLSKALQALSGSEGTTLFMTLLAAFNVLLHRYTGQDDIVIGSPIANRNHIETEQLIGFFVNTLALRTDLSGNPTFHDLLRRVREVALGAYAHQDLPFERLVDVLQLPRDLSRPPLFQVLFVLQNAPLPPLNLVDLVLEPVAVERQTSRFDLTLELTQTEHGLTAMFEYNTDLFDAATIERLAAHFQTLLEAIVADPHQRINRLPLLTSAEAQQILHDWNATAAPQPAARYVHERIADQAARMPQAIAVVAADGQITYAELDRRANQLARRLQALGVGPDRCVGVGVDPSLDLIVAILGILKAGGAYLPLDPRYPAERLDSMVTDAGAPLLIARRRSLPDLPSYQGQILWLDTAWESIASESADAPFSPVTPQNLAYIIYTSGSTGRPKGVLISHANLAHSTQARSDYYHDPITAFLLLSSVAFDSSVAGIFWTLCQGGTLCLPPESDRADPAQLARLIAQHQVSHLLGLPSLYALMVEQAPSGQLDSLRVAIVAGEPCPRLLVDQHQRTLPEVALFNEYGPTEGTVWSTVYAASGADISDPAPIGRPIPHVGVYGLDAQLQPVPIGVAGELYIGGPQVARGYLNRPDLTAERFVPNPFASEPGARLYRTGDRARFLPDGTIEFLGRSDRQVKLRGYRIELGEIESVLRDHSAIHAAVVEMRPTQAGHPQLVAYLVPRHAADVASEVGLATAELRAYLGERLPAYMVPAAFVLLESLPLTPNGKIDRRALPEPERATVAQAVAPRTDTETVLARIWADVLNIEHVGIHDNFFTLGGDSILSIQIVARANQAGLQLTPGQLFQYQTIADLASVVTTRRAADAETDNAPGPVPLTPIQRWFFEQNLPNPHHFNQSLLLESRQPLDFALLNQAVQHLARHHAALRLRFVADAHGWQQFDPGDPPEIPCRHVDLSAVLLAEQPTVIEQSAADAQASLDLARGPLMRVVLFDRGADQTQRLLLVIHHLVVDGVSWRILVDDLQTVYSQLARGAAVMLPAMTTSFQRWAAQVSTYAQTEALRAELPYWLRLADRSLPGPPLDKPRGANLVATAREITLALDAEETHALLHDVPPIYHTQINDVLLTALIQGFAAWTGQRILLLDLEGHGRENVLADVDLSRTVGWFTSVFPVVLELPHDSGPGAALKAVKEQLRQIPRRGIGYGILRYLSPDDTAAALRTLPRPEINFNYLGQTDQSPRSSLFVVAPESSGPNVDPQAQRSYLLEISGIVTGGQLRLQWLYSEQIHHRATIEAFAQHTLAALRALIQHCLSPEAGGYTPSDFPAARVSQSDLNKLLGMIGNKGGPTQR